MKKILILLIFTLFTINGANATKIITTLEDGMVLKCEATKSSGSIKEYTTFTDYYEYKNGKIYSQNLSKMFGNPNHTKKVKNLKISNRSISFKDRLYRGGASHYKWVNINRETGRYSYRAKKQYNWAWYCQTARGTGKCTIFNE